MTSLGLVFAIDHPLAEEIQSVQNRMMKSRSYPFIAYFFMLPILQVMVFDQFDLGAQLVPHVTLLFLIFIPRCRPNLLPLSCLSIWSLFRHPPLNNRSPSSCKCYRSFYKTFCHRSFLVKPRICQYSLTTDTSACPICLLFKCGSDSSSILCL